ncbi:MAG: hypothetical protein ACJ8F7_01895 [Gemmataceae bacterium]
MKRLLGSALAGALCLGLAFAADPPKPAESKDSAESILKEMIDRINELGDQLTKVTDEKTAKESKKKIEETCTKLNALKDRAEKLRKDKDEAKKFEDPKLEEKYKTQLESAAKKLATEGERLKAQPYGKEILTAIAAKGTPAAGPTPTAPVAPPSKE